MAHSIDADQMHQTIRLFMEQGQTVELRGRDVPDEHGRRRMLRGYFRDTEKLAAHAEGLARRGGIVEITLNPLLPATWSRCADRVEVVAAGTPTAGEADVAERRWLLIDVDPIRPSDVSATDAEKAEALRRALDIRDALRAEGWPDPVVADSGNGVHLIYRVSLPASSDLPRRCLEALDFRFSDARVAVDVGAAAAARLVKLYGQVARKGDSTPERPHRPSRLLVVPVPLTVVPTELLERLACSLPSEPRRAARDAGGFDVDEWLREHGAEARGPAPWRNARRWVLARCPFNPGHRFTAYVVQFPNGTVAAGCLHRDCQGRGWTEMRALMERQAGPSGDDSEPATVPVEQASTANSSSRPVVRVNDRHRREITEDCLQILRAVGPPPVVYQRGTALVRVRGEAIEPLTVAALGGILDRLVDFVMEHGNARRPARPPSDVVADILALSDPGLPQLRGLVHSPVFLAPDGRLLAEDGYDAASGLLVRLNGLHGVQPDMPIDEARRWIEVEMLGDFPFAGDSDRAHAVAMLLQTFVRPLIHGPTPLYVVESATPGTGKTLLVHAVAMVVTGRPAPVMPLPRPWNPRAGGRRRGISDDSELDKRLLARLLRGDAFILLDNVGALDSEVLAAALTATEYSGRILGRTETVSVPNDAVWACTGNNVEASDEILRRAVLIRLVSDEEHPEERTHFRHPDLLGWIQAHRRALVRACLSLVARWVERGMPPGKRVLGSYEQWARVIGGILGEAGVYGFLSDIRERRERPDREALEWRALCEAWWGRYGMRAVTAGDVLRVAQEGNLLADLWIGRSELAAQQRMGRELALRRDRVYGAWRIRYAGVDSSLHSHSYRLELVIPPAKTPASPETPAAEPQTTATAGSADKDALRGFAGVSGAPVQNPGWEGAFQNSDTTPVGPIAGGASGKSGVFEVTYPDGREHARARRTVSLE